MGKFLKNLSSYGFIIFMNIDDIKNFLDNEPLIKELKLDCRCPNKYKSNLNILNKLKIKNSIIKNINEIKYLIRNKDNLKNLHIFCPICRNKNRFKGYSLGYHEHCNSSCAALDSKVQQKYEQTCLRRHNKKRFTNNKKSKETKKIKYGDPNYNNKNKRHVTCINNIDENGLNSYQRQNIKAVKTRKNLIDENNLNSFQRAAIKAIETSLNNIDKDGLNSYQRAVKTRENSMKILYGKPYYAQTEQFKNIFKDTKRALQIKQREYETRKKNGTLKGSNPEDIIHQFLIYKFDFDDVIRWYRDNIKYPFNCDFYIKSLDLFIEINFDPSHGKEPFDKNNKQHLEIVKKWELKSKELNHKNKTKDRYLNFIHVWTERDVLKQKTFIDNKLNYKIFYNLDQFLEWFNNL